MALVYHHFGYNTVKEHGSFLEPFFNNFLQVCFLDNHAVINIRKHRAARKLDKSSDFLFHSKSADRFPGNIVRIDLDNLAGELVCG